MGTRAIIRLKLDSETIHHVFVQFDGYYSYLGCQLLEVYRQSTMADILHRLDKIQWIPQDTTEPKSLSESRERTLTELRYNRKEAQVINVLKGISIEMTHKPSVDFVISNFAYFYKGEWRTEEKPTNLHDNLIVVNGEQKLGIMDINPNVYGMIEYVYQYDATTDTLDMFVSKSPTVTAHAEHTLTLGDMTFVHTFHVNRQTRISTLMHFFKMMDTLEETEEWREETIPYENLLFKTFLNQHYDTFNNI